LNQKYDKLLSNFAFNFNLRPYTRGRQLTPAFIEAVLWDVLNDPEVGWGVVQSQVEPNPAPFEICSWFRQLLKLKYNKNMIHRFQDLLSFSTECARTRRERRGRGS